MLSSVSSFMFRTAGSIASQSTSGRKLSILVYHRVLTEPDPMRPGEVDRVQFDMQMGVLAEFFNVIPLRNAIQLLKNGRLPSRAVCITFDDGYSDNEGVALPILQSYGISATFFLATGFLDGGRMWNDSIIEAIRYAESGRLDLSEEGLGQFNLHDLESRLQAKSTLIAKLKYLPLSERARKTRYISDVIGKTLPDDLMMTSEQVNKLAAGGMELGAHTVNHPILKSLDDGAAYREIDQSRSAVERIAGSPVTIFAYPNGQPELDYSCRDVTLVKEAGFDGAVSTARGVSLPGSDSFQLPRCNPWDRSRRRFALRLLRNLGRTRATVA